MLHVVRQRSEGRQERVELHGGDPDGVRVGDAIAAPVLLLARQVGVELADNAGDGRRSLRVVADAEGEVGGPEEDGRPARGVLDGLKPRSHVR